jgi:hypothetical protein
MLASFRPLFLEIHKLQLCLFVDKNPTMLIVDGLDILRLLDGAYVKVDLSLAILLFHIFFGNAYSLLFALATVHAMQTPRVLWFNFQQSALQVANTYLHSCAQAIHEPFSSISFSPLVLVQPH